MSEAIKNKTGINVIRNFKRRIKSIAIGWRSRNGLPATSFLASLILVAAIVHGSLFDPLADSVHQTFGYSPQHTAEGDWLKLFTSLLLTSDPSHLGAAFVMTLLCIGWLEYQSGWRAAVIVFLFAHLLTLLSTSAIILAMHRSAPSCFTEALRHAADIGPSAGYYACLAIAMINSKLAYRRLLLCVTTAFLVARLYLSVVDSTPPPSAVQSDLAHLVSFMLGVGLLSRRLIMKQLFRARIRLHR
jgi:membrane associated rhomboid family serine protease